MATPTITALRATSRPSIDGRLDEADWASAPACLGFVQVEPMEGGIPSNDTEVRVLFDHDALYVGARLLDQTPERIARGLTRRDEEYAGQYDYFEVILDPDLDGRTGYSFQVSAANQQLDQYLHGDTNRDLAWDAVWESSVQIDEAGWTVEIRIPFSQLRYDAADGGQSWGINFLRRRVATDEVSAFALESRLASGRVSQAGLLHGLSVSGAVGRTEIRPYVLGQAQSSPVEEGNPFSRPREHGVRMGADVRIGMGSSFTLDATINPDFGQVEADPAVINLTTVETFLEERRPFFVKDARIFDFALAGPPNHRAFYSRRIGRAPHRSTLPGADFSSAPEVSRILAAAKVTGRTSGGFSLGALTALTGESTGEAYFAAEDRVQPFIGDPQTWFGVLRGRQEFREGQSTLGAILTAVNRSIPAQGDLHVLPSDALVGGVDFEHWWGGREWVVFGFLAGTHVRGDSTAMLRIQQSPGHFLQRPDLEWATFDPSATSLSGMEWQAEVNRRRGRLQGNLRLRQVLPGVEANDLGFTNISERLGGVVQLFYREVRPSRWYRDFQVNFFSSRSLSHELLAAPLSLERMRWAEMQWETRLGGNITLPNSWKVNSQVNYFRDALSRSEARGGPRMLDPAFGQWSLELTTDERRPVVLAPRLRIGRGAQDSQRELELGLTTRLHVSPRLEVQVAPSFLSSTTGAQYVTATRAVPYDPTFGTRYIFAELERRDLGLEGRVNWILTPRVSLQLYTQPLVSSGDFVTFRQLLRAESYDFQDFQDGTFVEGMESPRCSVGTTCVDATGLRWIDFDGNGFADHSFPDPGFSIRSFRTTGLVRWEYRPGSTLYLVWQRRQFERLREPGLDVRRDARALISLPPHDVFIVKADLLVNR